MARTGRALGIGSTDLLIVLPALGLAACAILWCHSHGVALCPFRGLTGLPCPFCGGTRSVVALFGGEPIRALEYNPLVCVGVLLAPVYWASRPWWKRSGLADRVVPAVKLTLLALVVVANWAYLLCVGR